MNIQIAWSRQPVNPNSSTDENGFVEMFFTRVSGVRFKLKAKHINSCDEHASFWQHIPFQRSANCLTKIELWQSEDGETIWIYATPEESVKQILIGAFK